MTETIQPLSGYHRRYLVRQSVGIWLSGYLGILVSGEAMSKYLVRCSGGIWVSAPGVQSPSHSCRHRPDLIYQNIWNQKICCCLTNKLCVLINFQSFLSQEGAAAERGDLKHDQWSPQFIRKCVMDVAQKINPPVREVLRIVNVQWEALFVYICWVWGGVCALQ